MLSERLILRPPDSVMPRQFLNVPVTKEWVGTMLMVLSQF